MSLIFTSHTGEVIEVKDYVTPKSVVHKDSSRSALPLQTIPTPLSLALTMQTLSIDTPLNQFPIGTPLHPSPPTSHEAGRSKASSHKPIITVTDTQQLPASPNMAEISPLPIPQNLHKVRSVSRFKSGRESGTSNSTTTTKEDDPALWMVYNEYGELVTIEQMAKPIVAKELTVTQALRLVYKMYHAEVGHL